MSYFSLHECYKNFLLFYILPYQKDSTDRDFRTIPAILRLYFLHITIQLLQNSQRCTVYQQMQFLVQPSTGLTGGGKIAFLNGHYSEKRLFANSSAITACLPANGRVNQWTSEPALPKIHPRTHTYMFQKIAGSLVHWFTGSVLLRQIRPPKKCPIIKISLSSIPSCVFRGSPAGRQQTKPPQKMYYY